MLRFRIRPCASCTGEGEAWGVFKVRPVAGLARIRLPVLGDNWRVRSNSLHVVSQMHDGHGDLQQAGRKVDDKCARC
eukprot:190114-Amphidinium_carterae.1